MRFGALRSAVTAIALVASTIPPGVLRGSARGGDGGEESLEMRALNGPRGDVAALILGGSDGGSLRVAASAAAECGPAGGAATSVSFWVEVEARSLLDAIGSVDAAEPTESMRLELYAYAMTREGEIAASLAEWVRVGLDALAARPGGGIKLPARFELPPGEVQLRLLVREPRSQRFALRVIGLEVPAASSGLALAPPAFADPGDRWIFVRPKDAAAGWSPERLTAALPVVPIGGERELRIRGCGLEGATLGAVAQTLEGRPVDGIEVQLAAPEAEGASGRLVVRGDRGLAPGVYRLEISAKSARDEASTVQPLFVAPADSSGDTTVAWTALGVDSAAPPSPQRAAEAGSDEQGGEVAAVAAGYRVVLGLLAQGRREEAVDRLVVLQADLADEVEKPKRAVNRLDAAQNRVTRQLLDHDPECLLPVLLLHLDLEERYQETGGVSPFLLEANRSRIRALAQVYAEEAKSEMGRGLAALSLALMADALEQAQQRVSALVVLRDALALDPANPEVLLDLAFQFENHGFGEEAMTMLERLLELEPRSDEGRLRYAMNLARADRHVEAAEVLRRLVRDGESEWVLAVAYQELGQQLIRGERFGEAVRLLREGAGRFPSVQRLRLVLAYALDRAGDRHGARATLAALPPDDGRPSPRLRYRVPRGQEERRAREFLVRHATARFPLLAQAVSSSGGSR